MLCNKIRDTERGSDFALCHWKNKESCRELEKIR